MTEQHPPPGEEPPYGQVPYQPYGAPPPGINIPLRQDHPDATTAMVLGITSIGIVMIGLGCYGLISWVGAVVGPIAIVKARRAMAEIDAAPERFTNRGHAVTGQICGIVGTVLGAMVIVGGLAVLAVIIVTGASS